MATTPNKSLIDATPNLLAVLLGLCLPAMASGRATLQAVAALCLILAIFCATRDGAIVQDFKRALRTPVAKLTVLAFAGMAVSLLSSLDTQRSFEAWGRTGIFVIAGVLFWAFLRQQMDRISTCHRGLILGTMVVGLIAASGFLGFPWPLRLLKMELQELRQIHLDAWVFDTLKAYAATAACVIPALGLIAYRTKDHWRWLAIVAAILCLTIVIASNNKSALAGILAMSIIVSLLAAWRRGGRWIIAWIAWALLSSAAILYLVNILPEPPPSPAVWDWIPTWLIDSHRQQIWNFTAERVLEAPWVGHGINVIERVPGAGDILPGYRVQVLPSHPHNWMLEILAETGLIGFIPTVLALAWFFVSRARDYLSFGYCESLAQVGIGCVFWGSALFNFSIWSSWWLITFFVLIAIVEASRGKTP